MTFLISFLFAVFVVLVLPGYVLNAVLFRKNERVVFFESIHLAFGSSLISLFLVSLAAFSLNLSFATATILLFLLPLGIALAAMLGFPANVSWLPFQPPKLTSRQDLIILLPTISFVLVYLIFGYRIEMAILGQEDKLVLLMAQKMAHADSLVIDHLYFRPGGTYQYIYSLLSYLIAQISYISHLEPVQIYNKLRVVLYLITLSVTFGITRVLFPEKRLLPWFVVLFACATIWSGWGTRYTGAGFGQFFPMSQYYEFVICAVAPTAFSLFVRGLRGGWKYSLLSILLTVSIMFIHPREAAAVLVLYAAAIAGLVLTGGIDKRTIAKGLAVIAGVIIIGGAVREVQQMIIEPDMAFVMSEQKNSNADKLEKLLAESSIIEMFYPPRESDDELNYAFNLFYVNPFYLMAAFLAPLMLLSRRTFGLRVFGPTILAPVAISAVPLFAMVVVYVTYSQFLIGVPVAFMFPYVYIVVAVACWLAAESTARIISRRNGVRQFAFATVALVGLVIAIPYILQLPQYLYKISPGIALGWMSFGAFGCWYIGRKYIPAVILAHREPTSQNMYTLLAGLAIVVGIGLQGYYDGPKMGRKTKIESFPALYARFADSPSVVDWETWYAQSTFRDLPLHVVSFIRNKVPVGRVFAAPVSKTIAWYSPLYNLAAMTGQYVYTSGSYTTFREVSFFEELYRYRNKVSLAWRMQDEGFRRDLINLVYKGDNLRIFQQSVIVQNISTTLRYFDIFMREHQPIFNNYDSPQVTLDLIRKFSIEYIFVPSEWRETVEQRLAGLQGSVERIYFKDGYAIYRVNGQGAG